MTQIVAECLTLNNLAILPRMFFAIFVIVILIVVNVIVVVVVVVMFLLAFAAYFLSCCARYMLSDTPGGSNGLYNHFNVKLNYS